MIVIPCIRQHIGDQAVVGNTVYVVIKGTATRNLPVERTDLFTIGKAFVHRLEALEGVTKRSEFIRLKVSWKVIAIDLFKTWAHLIHKAAMIPGKTNPEIVGVHIIAIIIRITLISVVHQVHDPIVA